MSFSYNPEELAEKPLYQVRLNTGQTDQYSDIAITDEEIQYFLTRSYGDVDRASIDVITALIGKASGLTDKVTGQTSEAQSKLIDNLMKLRDDMISTIRVVPSFAGFTGVFEAQRTETHNDETIYQDGLRLHTEGIYKES